MDNNGEGLIPRLFDQILHSHASPPPETNQKLVG